MRKCCANCIGDKQLRRRIIPFLTESWGTCSYCNSEKELLIEPSLLRDYFELIINAYSRNDSGQTLVELLKKDWDIFQHPMMDLVHSNELLADILDDGDIVCELFAPSGTSHSDKLNLWGKLRSELMYENRFFLSSGIDEDRLKNLLMHLVLEPDEILGTWYRARIQQEDKPYPIEEMGAPPKRKASHGRANPAGIPYLYLASTVDTAISEIRPHTGETVCVADFNISPDVSLVDLRNPRATVSPFILSDENEVSLLREDIGFLQHLGDELTRPVLTQAAAIDYIPSQYLCEFIKKCGFHGVTYSSSESDGMNLALFDVQQAKIGDVKQYRVSRVSVEIES